MPCRRAISVTTAPGANVSSMIRILSSRDQRRRRSTPPRTSTASTDLNASLKATCCVRSLSFNKAAYRGGYAGHTPSRCELAHYPGWFQTDTVDTKSVCGNSAVLKQPREVRDLERQLKKVTIAGENSEPQAELLGTHSWRSAFYWNTFRG